MSVDPEKAAQLICGDCTGGLQRLRNCNGKGSPAKIDLNNRLYTRCPRAIYLESYEARYLWNLYVQCKETKCMPAPGAALSQTAFAVELFSYLDSLHNEHNAQLRKKAEKKSK